MLLWGWAWESKVERWTSKMQSRQVTRTWRYEGCSLSSPWSYKLNSYNSTKDSLCNTQRHLRDPCMETSAGGRIWANNGRGKGEVYVGHGMQLVALCSPRRGDGGDCRCTLCGPEHCFLRDQHIIRGNPVIGAELSGQRQNTEAQQLWFNSPHCQAEKWSLGAFSHFPKLTFPISSQC